MASSRAALASAAELPADSGPHGPAAALLRIPFEDRDPQVVDGVSHLLHAEGVIAAGRGRDEGPQVVADAVELDGLRRPELDELLLREGRPAR